MIFQPVKKEIMKQITLTSKITIFFHNLNVRIICLWFRFLRKTFNYYQDTSVIPSGEYCYNFDDELNDIDAVNPNEADLIPWRSEDAGLSW
jgi:hypothetical protein